MKKIVWNFIERFLIQVALNGIRLTKNLRDDTNILGISYFFLGIIDAISPHQEFSMWVTQKFGTYHIILHVLLILFGILSIYFCNKLSSTRIMLLSIPFLIHFSLGTHYLIITSSNIGELLYLFIVMAILLRSALSSIIIELITGRKDNHG